MSDFLAFHPSPQEVLVNESNNRLKDLEDIIKAADFYYPQVDPSQAIQLLAQGIERWRFHVDLLKGSPFKEEWTGVLKALILTRLDEDRGHIGRRHSPQNQELTRCMFDQTTTFGGISYDKNYPPSWVINTPVFEFDCELPRPAHLAHLIILWNGGERPRSYDDFPPEAKRLFAGRGRITPLEAAVSLVFLRYPKEAAREIINNSSLCRSIDENLLDILYEVGVGETGWVLNPYEKKNLNYIPFGNDFFSVVTLLEEKGVDVTGLRNEPVRTRMKGYGRAAVRTVLGQLMELKIIPEEGSRRKNAENIFKKFLTGHVPTAYARIIPGGFADGSGTLFYQEKEDPLDDLTTLVARAIESDLREYVKEEQLETEGIEFNVRTHREIIEETPEAMKEHERKKIGYHEDGIRLTINAPILDGKNERIKWVNDDEEPDIPSAQTRENERVITHMQKLYRRAISYLTRLGIIHRTDAHIKDTFEIKGEDPVTGELIWDAVWEVGANFILAGVNGKFWRLFDEEN